MLIQDFFSGIHAHPSQCPKCDTFSLQAFGTNLWECATCEGTAHLFFGVHIMSFGWLEKECRITILNNSHFQKAQCYKDDFEICVDTLCKKDQTISQSSYLPASPEMDIKRIKYEQLIKFLTFA